MSPYPSVNFHVIARQIIAEYGFIADFPASVNREAERLSVAINPVAAEAPIQDLRSLLWSSIDNHDSLDLDQVEFCQQRDNGDIRVRIAIADVDEFVPKASAIDGHAAKNATSVYTGVDVFPMLPTQLCNDLTSLKEGADRLAIVIEYAVRPDGTTRAENVYRALVHNHAKLVYETVGEWLEGKGPLPAKIAEVSGLEEQIRLQDEVTSRLRSQRHHKGALELEMIEVKPVMEDNEIVDLAVRQRTRAHGIIEEFMVAANGVMVRFLESKGSATIQRVVRTPERWPRIVEIAATHGHDLPEDPDPKALSEFLDSRHKNDPEHFPDLSLSVIKLLGRGEYMVAYPGVPHEGHFGLAVGDYTHSTAPNRRYVDLIIQRLLKDALVRAPVPYRKTELKFIAERCSDRDQAAKKVERFMRKVAGALLMSGHIGEAFDAIVTGASDKGVYVRLSHPPVEGRVVRGEKGLKIGEKTRVRLTRMDPERGFIDFERLVGSSFKAARRGSKTKPK